jgi:transposase-like protein
MTNKEREQQWGQMITAQKSSGQTMIRWCEDNHINPKTFYRWRSKLLKQGIISNSITTQTFQKYSSNEQQFHLVRSYDIKNDDIGCISITIGKATIDINNNFNEHILTSVLRIVSNVC